MALYRRNKTWWISLVDARGKSIRRTTRTSDKKRAEALYDALKLKIRLNPDYQTHNEPRLAEAIQLWLSQKASKATRERDRRVLAFFDIRLGNMKLADIKARHILEALADRPDFKASTVNVYLSIIKGVLNRAMRVWELLDKAPYLSGPKGTCPDTLGFWQR
jgi:hypothetical protein